MLSEKNLFNHKILSGIDKSKEIAMCWPSVNPWSSIHLCSLCSNWQNAGLTWSINLVTYKVWARSNMMMGGSKILSVECLSFYNMSSLSISLGEPESGCPILV